MKDRYKYNKRTLAIVVYQSGGSLGYEYFTAMDTEK